MEEVNSNLKSQISNLKSLLKHYWGYDDFRGIQREIIESISSGHDTLGLMPTGGGKSITFQVPALASDGVCIVITPLIALMKDQVTNLRKRGIRAAAIYSGMNHDDVLRVLENAVFGGLKLLYVSPERLSSELFIRKLQHIQVSFICVDEAHCICQWGYDFRPSYLNIISIRHEKPDAPVLALTATATPAVVEDIQEKLSLTPAAPLPDGEQPQAQGFNVFSMSFERTNLAYVVRHVDNKYSQLIHILQRVGGSAIVYTRSRERTREIDKCLKAEGISSTFFHAGLDIEVKDSRQKDWQEGRVRVMVATNAFGMGIDKPDVRVVIHADGPDSIEEYFQEAGRAGRDGKKSYAVLLTDDNDLRVLKGRIDSSYPPLDEVRAVYDHLAYFYQIGVGSGYNATFAFDIRKFCVNFHHFPLRVNSALMILQRAGYLEYSEERNSQARIHFTLERDDLYRLRDNPPKEDALIVALLRNYSGLFSEEVYVNEQLLAQQTGMTQQEVYLTLKELSRKHILNFIPQRATPLIRFTQRREDSEHLVFPPSAYEDMKLRYTERIEHMMDYISYDNECRSRFLLAYFGEKSDHDCGQCDVCQQRRTAGRDKAKAEARQKILEMLSDGHPHSIDDLKAVDAPLQVLQEVLREMMIEEEIVDDDGMVVKR